MDVFASDILSQVNSRLKNPKALNNSRLPLVRIGVACCDHVYNGPLSHSVTLILNHRRGGTSSSAEQPGFKSQLCHLPAELVFSKFTSTLHAWISSLVNWRCLQNLTSKVEQHSEQHPTQLALQEVFSIVVIVGSLASDQLI